MSQVQRPASNASSNACHAVEAAQARFPRQRHTVERGGDAVRQQLRFRLVQRDIGSEADAGSRLQLALERIAMDVDDTGQHQQTARIQFRSAPVAADAGDTPILQRQVHCLLAVRAQQYPPARDPQSVHRSRS